MKKWMFLPFLLMRKVYDSLKMAYLKVQFNEFGEESTITNNIEVTWPGNINIGKNVSIGSNVFLWASSKGSITLGDSCAIAAGVKFVTPTHDYNVLPV